MKRRALVLGIAAAATLPLRGLAQERTVRIGVLGRGPLKVSPYGSAMLQSLAQRGYRVVEYRAGDGSAERYREQAKELVGLRCDLIIAIGNEAPVRALQALKPRSPIVFLAGDYDPVEGGVLTDLAHPDRNATGVYIPQNGLVAKRVELIREVLPNAKRLLVFADSLSVPQVDSAINAANAAGFEVTVVQFRNQPYDYAGALESARRPTIEAFMNLASLIFTRDRQQLGDALARLRIPAVGSHALHADAGYLLALGSNVSKVTDRVADISVRLLKGAVPAEIAVEQAPEFDVAVNSKTAALLGIKIPESVIGRATRIIV